MAEPGYERVVGLIAAQLDAASTLLKFAADDLRDLVERAETIFHEDVLMIVENLHVQASSLNANAAFIQRLDLVEAPECEMSPEFEVMRAQAFEHR